MQCAVEDPTRMDVKRANNGEACLMNTLFSLLAQYETAQIPLDQCCHLFGLKPEEAAKRAGRHALPVPAFRIGTQKSPWLVDARTLAEHLDILRTNAAREWDKIKNAGSSKSF